MGEWSQGIFPLVSDLDKYVYTLPGKLCKKDIDRKTERPLEGHIDTDWEKTDWEKTETEKEKDRERQRESESVRESQRESQRESERVRETVTQKGEKLQRGEKNNVKDRDKESWLKD